jgi:hypothetical protein
VAAEANRSRWLAGVLFLLLWGLITHGTFAGTGDEPHYQMIAHSLVFDRDLDLSTDYANPANRALGGRLDAGAHVRPGRDARLRPVHDIGLPLLFAPYYFAAYNTTEWIVATVPPSWLERARLNFTVTLRHLLSLGMIGVTVWIGVQLLKLFSVLSGRPGRAFAWSLLFVLSPPFVSHSFLFFTEILSAALGLAVFIWLRGGALAAPTPERRLQALAAGLAVGYLLLVHARNAGLIAGLLVFAVLQARRAGTGALLPMFLAGAASMGALRTGITYHLWGTWLTTPHATWGAVDSWRPFAAESVTRLAGWLFDQEHGLLLYAPIYLLVPAGWMALWRRERELCQALTIVIAAYVGIMAIPVLNVHGWRGGWTPAARFLVPIAPYLALLAFGAVAFLPRLPSLIVVLILVQAGLDALLWQNPRLLWNEGIGTSALLRFLDMDTGLLSRHAPSMLAPVSAPTVVSIAVVLAGWLALTAWLALRSARLVRLKTDPTHGS